MYYREIGREYYPKRIYPFKEERRESSRFCNNFFIDLARENIKQFNTMKLLMFRKYYFDLNCVKTFVHRKKKKEKKSLFLIQSLLALFNHEYFAIQKKKGEEFLFYINIIDNNIRPIVFSR